MNLNRLIQLEQKIAEIDVKLVEYYLLIAELYVNGKTSLVTNPSAKCSQLLDKRIRYVNQVQPVIMYNRHRNLPDDVIVAINKKYLAHIAREKSNSRRVYLQERLAKILVSNMVLAVNGEIVERNEYYHLLQTHVDVSTRGHKKGDIVMCSECVWEVKDVIPGVNGDDLKLLMLYNNRLDICYGGSRLEIHKDSKCVPVAKNYLKQIKEYQKAAREMAIAHRKASKELLEALQSNLIK